MQKYTLTPDGHRNLTAELHHLKNVRHPRAVTRLGKAREMGDLRENSEYHAAREDLATIVGRMGELETILQQAALVEHAIDTINADLVRLGCKVTIEKNGLKETVHIVGQIEADPTQKKISDISPLGRALLGKKKGDIVTLEIPNGTHIYTILEIHVR